MGEWTVQSGGGSYQRPFLVMDGKRLIAQILGNQLEPKEQSIREAEKNAHLIAAAPELYEAACLALKRLGEQNRDDQAGIRMVLGNAIAKAQGKQ